MSSAGIRIVAATALDKDSRYFEGRKQPQLTLPVEKTEPTSAFEDDDEIFWEKNLDVTNNTFVLVRNGYFQVEKNV